MSLDRESHKARTIAAALAQGWINTEGVKAETSNVSYLVEREGMAHLGDRHTTKPSLPRPIGFW